MITIIKTKQEATYRVLLKLIEAIRYHNLYEELQRMDELTKDMVVRIK